MIQVNLLPEEFRIKPKDPKKGQYARLGILFGSFFVLGTLYFFVDYLKISKAIHDLDGKWRQVQPQSQELNALKSQVEVVLKQEKQFLEQFVTTQKPVTHLMMWASELLPEGAWLEEMTLGHDKGKVNFLLRGSCMNSKVKTSIEQIEMYLQSLKQRMPDAKLVLKTSRLDVAQTELTQFSANFSWSETSGTVAS